MQGMRNREKMLRVESSTFCLSCPSGMSTEGASAQFACGDCITGHILGIGLGVLHSRNQGMYQNITASTTCVSCDRGRYIDVDGSSSCYECAQGRYGPSMGLTSCVALPAGSLSGYQYHIRVPPMLSWFIYIRHGYDCMPCVLKAHMHQHSEGPDDAPHVIPVRLPMIRIAVRVVYVLLAVINPPLVVDLA